MMIALARRCACPLDDQNHHERGKMCEVNRLLPDGASAVYIMGGRFVRFNPLDCDPKLLKEHLRYFEEPRLAGVAVPQVLVARYAKYMRMDEDKYLNSYLTLVVMKELEDVLAAVRYKTAEGPGKRNSRQGVQASAARERIAP